MSELAATTLMSTGTNRQGATPAPLTPTEVLEELRYSGYIGAGNGLTRKGTIARERLIDELSNF